VEEMQSLLSRSKMVGIMNNLLKQEFEKLQALFRSVNRPFPKVIGATGADFERVYQTTGIQLSGGIVDFYKEMNGSGREEILAVFSDEPTLCQFNSTDFALYIWGASEPNIDEYYRELQKAWDGCEQDPPRDVRIKKGLWANKLWFPFADFNGGATKVYWDADPASTGWVGQIIVYQHDPEGIYYAAPDFETFLKSSNELLVKNRREFLERTFD
jgi:cell wall assembly regulator SMI1